MTWQPIATAPSGTNVLVVEKMRGIEVAFHHPDYGWMSKPGRYTVIPTHWMPLPEPPDVSEGAE